VITHENTLKLHLNHFNKKSLPGHRDICPKRHFSERH
jgi:hypothetical protein